MDPNFCLVRLRDPRDGVTGLCATLTPADEALNIAADELAEAFAELDSSLARGGYAPGVWKAAAQ